MAVAEDYYEYEIRANRAKFQLGEGPTVVFGIAATVLGVTFAGMALFVYWASDSLEVRLAGVMIATVTVLMRCYS